MASTKFHIEKCRDAHGWELRLSGVFDGTSAWELRHAVARVGKNTPLVIDFSDVTELYDFGAATLAAGFLARRWPPVLFVGLRPEQRAVLRRHGLNFDQPGILDTLPGHPVFGAIEAP